MVVVVITTEGSIVKIVVGTEAIGECFDLDNCVVVVIVDTRHNTRKKTPFGCFAPKGCA